MAKDEGQISLTPEQLKELMTAMGTAMAEKLAAAQTDVAKVSATAAAEAHKAVSSEKWNAPDDKKSHYNPEGDVANPRPPLSREILFCGYRLRANEMTRAEIEAFNQIKPGVYHGGRWKVDEQEPGTPNGPLRVWLAEAADKDQRASLPSLLEIGKELAGLTASPV